MHEYLSGFGNEHASEALPGALPVGQFSPQHPPLGLYPEQFSGTAFTAPRALNRRSWLYRIRPSVSQISGATFVPSNAADGWRSAPDAKGMLRPDPLRWSPAAPAGGKFHNNISTFVTTGSVAERVGGALHTYSCTEPMTNDYLCVADSELVVVPVSGALQLRTECGRLAVAPRRDCAVTGRYEVFGLPPSGVQRHHTAGNGVPV